MNWLLRVWRLLKMLYQLLCCALSLLTFIFNIFWFLCNLASAAIPWCTLVVLVACIASKFVKLRRPKDAHLVSLLGAAQADGGTSPAYWAIANRGAGFDAPENSICALELMIKKGYRHVLLDVGLTSDEQLVIADRRMLVRAGLNGGIAAHSLAALRKLNITDYHPLSSKFNVVENVATLAELAVFFGEQTAVVTVFLLLSEHSRQLLDKLVACLNSQPEFAQRVVVVSNSPIDLYQLRKLKPEVVCGLWYENSLSRAFQNTSTLFTSAYGAFFRNIITPAIGITVVFLSKEEFNTHIGQLWRDVGVRPIVYNINMTSEKRYFQRTMKTQYLTDSLRSEPHLFERIK